MKWLATFGLACIAVFGFSWQGSDVYETLRVERYLVQVNVTDNAGNPIKDLNVSDFELKLGKKAQKVESLEYVQLDVPKTESGQVTESQDSRRMFIFFFDLRFNNERGVIAARNATIDFVKNELQPNDLAAAYVGSARRGVWPLINFTSDKNQLLYALDSLGLEDSEDRPRGPAGYYAGGITTDILGDYDPTSYQTGSLTSVSANVGFGPPGTPGGTSGGENFGLQALEALRQNLNEAQKMERRDYATQVMNFTESFRSFSRALSYVRGRKNLVLFSSGYDSSQLVGVSNRELQQNAELSLTGQNFEIDSNQLGNASVQSRMTDLVSALQGSGTVVFAVDTSGLDEESSSKTGIQALNMMAKDTGGQLFENENEFLKPLQKVKNITSEYYVLTVVPEGNFEKGAIEKLRIKVKRSGTRVYAQKGLLIRPEFETLNPLERQLHIADYIAKDLTSAGIPIALKATPLMEKTGLARVTVQLDIDGSYFTSKKRGEQPIEFYVMAIDQKENLTFDSTASQYRLNLNKVQESLDGAGIRYVTSLLLPPGDYRIKTVVRDLLDGQVGSQIEPVRIPEQLPRVSSVLLSDSAWVVLEGARDKIVDGVSFDYPFKLGKRIYTPAEGIQAEASSKTMFMFTVGDTPSGQVEPDIKALIQKPDGNAILIPADAIKADFPRDDAVRALTTIMLMIDFTKLDLPAGQQYTLLTQFTLADGQPIRHATAFKL